ncbi:MAG: serine/threonine-protein kinase, partial [Planctomycetota bacterium]|nr:serine/threonine-protein kinase [Planctomycetota bacterium]
AIRPSMGRDLLSWKEFAETNGNHLSVMELAIGCGFIDTDKAKAIANTPAENVQVDLKNTRLSPKKETSKSTKEKSRSKPVSKKIPGYKITGRLAAGSMGTVYVAKNEKTGEKVAIKVLSRSLRSKPANLQRFYRETNIMRAINHPNLVKAYEVGETQGGQPYLVMEFVEGQSLDKYLRKGPMNHQEAIRIARAIGQGLHHLHTRDFIHRDIKPENILLSEKGEVKVADFGLAKHLDDSYITHTETMIGTPLYMSPEQAKSETAIDIRADLYSLGCNLFHMVTGEPPYPGEHPLTVMTKHLYDKVPWAQDINRDVCPHLSRAIYHMMKKDRDKRYQTSRDVIMDLERVEAGEAPLRPNDHLKERRSRLTDALNKQQQLSESQGRLRDWFSRLVPAYHLPERL